LLNKSVFLAAVVVCVVAPFHSLAATVILSISGTYSDSTTFSGSLVYDQATQLVTSAAITDSAGDNPYGPQTYIGTGAYTVNPVTTYGCSSGCGFFGFEFYTASAPSGQPDLDLYFSGDPATFSGGTILPTVTFNGGTSTVTSREAFDEFTSRTLASGTASSGAPEPESILLLFSGAAMLAVRRRARLHKSRG
jgi:hypothetical protein